ncbi:MAG: hypothetical protein RIQ46_576 [Pseudomonadota bacterium]
MSRALQATCVSLKGRGLLITGQPGSGKSSLALALIDRGAQLVGDDSLLVEPRDGHLWAMPHPETRGLVEVRNLGLLPMPVLDGVAVALAIRLDKAAPRYAEGPEVLELQGIRLPLARLWPGGPVLPLKAELALRHWGIGHSGGN